CIVGPQDLTRPGIRGMEEPLAFAEEDQVAGYSYARAGINPWSHGVLPGDLSRTRIDRSVNAVTRRAGYEEGSRKCARPTRAQRIVRRVICNPNIERKITGMRVEEVGPRAVSRGRPFHSIRPWLENQWCWLHRCPHWSSGVAVRERELGLVLGQGSNRGHGLGWPGMLESRIRRRRGNWHLRIREERLAGAPIQDERVPCFRSMGNGRSALHVQQHGRLRSVKVPLVMVGKLEIPLQLPVLYVDRYNRCRVEVQSRAIAGIGPAESVTGGEVQGMEFRIVAWGSPNRPPASKVRVTLPRGGLSGPETPQKGAAVRIVR